MDNNSNQSKDSLFEGKLHCWQNTQGYRFSVDSVLLSHFCLHWKKAEILDLGCGNGILGLILLYRIPHDVKILTGIEFQKSLCALAKRNISSNGFDDKFAVIEGDYTQIRKYFNPEQFSHVICNPPFFKRGTGRLSSNREAYLARHQSGTTPKEIAATISYVMKNKGNAALIYPAEMFKELIVEFTKKRLEPKNIRFVYGYPESNYSNLVLVEFKKNGGDGCKISQPLYVYRTKNGDYSEEVQMMYKPTMEILV